ncbi:hypothetical protein SAY87_000512 [Trapa incisa]|uniref:Uncharacterized protein n=1 Tax=Trapa incisa TaxID=236973 RepID=A0AAN7GC80_9MYRT|nr:hypothetical protein SAY87_000512 [Trapa incisa]
MGWHHPEIGLDEMVKLVKGFVDILILSSGYQSSGLTAHWDADNIKKAFYWSLYFERVLSDLKDSKYYHESVQELDAALSELKSQSSFPLGLSHISSDTLVRASVLVAEHMIHTLPLRDAHLKAVLTAAIKMDLDAHAKTENDCLSKYLIRLNFLSIDPQDCSTSCEKKSALGEENMDNSYDWTSMSTRELFRRQTAVSDILSLQKALYSFSTTIRAFKGNNIILREQLKNAKFSLSEDEMDGFITWNKWKSKSLLYFLDKRTIRLISGVSMIFSSQKSQWIRLFECLANSENLHERVELLLLGCTVDRWSSIVEHFQTISFDCLTTLDRFIEVQNLLMGRSGRPFPRNENENSKESSILDYLTKILGHELHVLWMLSPALLAAAIPSWSTMLRIYLNQIEIQLKGELARYCGCTEETKEHRDCELAERIWCLHAFHTSNSLANVQ